MTAVIIVHVGIDVDILRLVVGEDVVFHVQLEDLRDFWLNFLQPLFQADILESLCFLHLLRLIRVTKVLLHSDTFAHGLRVRLIVEEEIVLRLEVDDCVDTNRSRVPPETLSLLLLASAATFGPFELVGKRLLIKKGIVKISI